MTVIDLDPIRHAAHTVLRFADRPRTTTAGWQELSRALVILRDVDLGSGRLHDAVLTLTATNADRDAVALRHALRELADVMHLPCPAAAMRAEQLRFDL
ncbi:MAG: hypothetical protein ACRDZ1_15130 [Acidimicrobiia bacterium]